MTVKLAMIIMSMLMMLGIIFTPVAVEWHLLLECGTENLMK